MENPGKKKKKFALLSIPAKDMNKFVIKNENI